MKKSIIAAVILIACLVLAPFGFGKIAAKRLDAGLDKLATQAPYFVIKDRSWEGGWFKSRQTVTLELAPGMRALVMPMAEAAEDPDSAAPPTTLTVVNEVLHGPVLGAAGIGVARVDSRFDLPADVVAKVRELFGEKPALEVQSRLGLFGGGRTVATSEGRTLKPSSGGEVTYQDFHMVVSYGKGAGSYEMDGRLPSVVINSPSDGSVTFTDLTLEGEGERVLGNLYDGEMAMKLAKLDIASSGNRVAINDVHIRSDTDTDDGMVAMSMKSGSGKVESADLLAATGLEINEVHYDLGFRRLHAETLDKITTAMQKSYASTPDAAVGPAAAMAALQSQVLAPFKEHAAELLKHDPEFVLDRIGVVTSAGDGIIKGLVRLVGVTVEDFSAAGLGNLLNKIECDFTLELAQSLVDRVPNGAMISGAGISGGFITREGDKLVSHIEFKGGALTINGKAQPLPPIPGVNAPVPPAVSAPEAPDEPPAAGV
jgi:uncharacterized protein YdgA (DUF945 family)